MTPQEIKDWIKNQGQGVVEIELAKAQIKMMRTYRADIDRTIAKLEKDQKKLQKKFRIA